MFQPDFPHFFSVQREEVDRLLQPMRDEIQSLLDDFMDGMSEQRRRSQQRLWRHGWMIDLHFPFLLVEKAIEEGRATDADVDDLLVSHYRDRLADIEHELQEAWPERASILGIAFDRHRNGDYTSSIPVMLAQADGMASELVSAKFFSTRNKRPRVAEALDKLQIDWRQFDSLIILEAVNGLTGSDADLVPGIMNRHRVMHGIDVDYGTQTNSYRAVSILQFVTHFLKPATVSAT